MFLGKIEQALEGIFFELRQIRFLLEIQQGTQLEEAQMELKEEDISVSFEELPKDEIETRIINNLYPVKEESYLFKDEMPQ